MSRILYSLLRVLQLQQQKHDLDLQQPVPGSRQRQRSWSTILLGSGIFAVVFGMIASMLQVVLVGGVLLQAGTAALVAGLVLTVAKVVPDILLPEAGTRRAIRAAVQPPDPAPLPITAFTWYNSYSCPFFLITKPTFME